MTLTAAGFPGSVNDIQWSQLITLLGHEGTTGFGVTAGAGDRNLVVGSGLSNVGGVLAVNTANETRQATTNPSSFSRIDRVVLRASWSAKTLTIAIKPGTPSASPQPPDLTQNAGVLWETRLARVTVGPGQGAFTSGNIVQERIPPSSGFYNTTSEGCPDPAVGALVWNRSTNLLQVAEDGEYVTVGRSGTLPISAGGTGRTTLYGSTTTTGPNKTSRRLLTVDSSNNIFASTGAIAAEYTGVQMHARITSVSFGAQGDAAVAHGAPFTPTLILAQAYLEHDSGSVIVVPRSSTPRWNDTNVFLRAKNTATGAPYTGPVSAVAIFSFGTA